MDKIEQGINELIKEFPNIKTSLSIFELISSSKVSPRPINAFFLFRKDLANRVLKSRKTIKPVILSKKASRIWKSLLDQEKLFWRKLSKISKTLHSLKYPFYRHSGCKKNNLNNNNEITSGIFDSTTNDEITSGIFDSTTNYEITTTYSSSQIIDNYDNNTNIFINYNNNLLTDINQYFFFEDNNNYYYCNLHEV